jgi:hypothetical protein
MSKTWTPVGLISKEFHLSLSNNETVKQGMLYTWEGEEYRWSHENLACLLKQKNIFDFIKKRPRFPWNNCRDPSQYNI